MDEKKKMVRHPNGSETGSASFRLHHFCFFLRSENSNLRCKKFLPDRYRIFPQKFRYENVMRLPARATGQRILSRNWVSAICFTVDTVMPSEAPLISSESRFGCNATLLAVHFLSWVRLRLAFAALSLHDKWNNAVTSIKDGILSFTVVFEISSADRK